MEKSSLPDKDVKVMITKMRNQLKRGRVNTMRNLTKKRYGVPVVAQWSTNPTRNHEVAGSIPAPAQWVNDLALP